MLKLIKNKNIFDVPSDCLVNPCNTVGVMGKGLALEFKKRFPDNNYEYKEYCNAGALKPGRLFIYFPSDFRPVAIVNFATKDHWKNPSKIEWIKSGLEDLADFLIKQKDIDSISIPALGCGLGGLNFDDVLNEIYEFEQVVMAERRQMNFYVFEPK